MIESKNSEDVDVVFRCWRRGGLRAGFRLIGLLSRIVRTDSAGLLRIGNNWSILAQHEAIFECLNVIVTDIGHCLQTQILGYSCRIKLHRDLRFNLKLSSQV